MLASTKWKGAGRLPSPSFLRGLSFFVIVSVATAKVETSFQNSQYPQYKDYFGSTPSYPQYPDLTVKSGSAGDISNGPLIGDTPSQDSLLGQSSAQQPVVHGAPNQHMYYYETYPMQDTSRGNAYSVPGPGGNKRCTYTANGHMKCYSRQDYGVMTASNDYDTTGSDDSSSSLGGLAGLIGLLGLKCLKGLATVVGPILLFPLLLPILIPLLLPLLLLLLIPILLIPIPVISVPAPTVRSLQSDFFEARKIASGVFERVISSDECVERLACEISKMSQKRKAGEWIERALNYLPESSPITKRIYKGFEIMNSTAAVQPEGKSEQQASCTMLKCKMMNLFESQKG